VGPVDLFYLRDGCRDVELPRVVEPHDPGSR
jgi:hypothetical protein